MFKVGDFVTGEDRSYKRSIYKVIRIRSIEEGEFDIEFLCLNGSTALEYEDATLSKRRLIKDFRLATVLDEELSLGISVNLILFVKRLIN